MRAKVTENTPLTIKEDIFVKNLFLTEFNKSKAARLAGMTVRDTDSSLIRDPLRLPNVKKKFDQLVEVHLASTRTSFEEKLNILKSAAQECFERKDFNNLVKLVSEMNKMEGHYKIIVETKDGDKDIQSVLHQMNRLKIIRKEF